MKRNFLLPNNDQLICTHQAAIFTFSAPRMVLSTAANLDNMVVLTKTWNSISITAAVSAGADVNALCAGDPATLFESDEEPCILSPGTINIFLITNQTLSPGAMTELLMTITEAKTTVLRDFMQGSSASNSIATGTGTDGIVIIGDCDFEHTLLNAGKINMRSIGWTGWKIVLLQLFFARETFLSSIFLPCFLEYIAKICYVNLEIIYTK